MLILHKIVMNCIEFEYSGRSGESVSNTCLLLFFKWRIFECIEIPERNTLESPERTKDIEVVSILGSI